MDKNKEINAEELYRYMIDTFPDYPCGKCKNKRNHMECSIERCGRYRSFFHRFWERVQSNYLALRLDQRIQGELMIERLADELEGSTQL